MSDTGISAEYPSVFCIFSTIHVVDFFCFFKVLLLLRTDDVSQSVVSLTVICIFPLRSFPNIGVGCCGEATCDADGPAVLWLFGGDASGTGGLKRRICVKPGRFVEAWSCFGFRFGILIFSACATLLVVEIQDLPFEIKLTSSAGLLFRLIFLFPKSFRIRSLLWFVIFCSSVFSEIFFDLRSIYWPNSVSRSFFGPNFAMSEFLRRTSCRFGSLITLVVGLIFPTGLPGARTSSKLSKFFFWRWRSKILRAIFSWTLCSLHGIGPASPSDAIRHP